MRDSRYPDGIQGAERLPYYQCRRKFLHPAGNLPLGNFRIETVCPDDNTADMFAQNRRDTAVSASAHSMYVKYDFPVHLVP